MSAIVGLIDWRGGPAAPAVKQALVALQLHGRDGEGLWDGGDAALGWRQTILTAEDRADGQPLTGGGGRFKLVFDGRLDNREELARFLSLAPERARDWPDSAYVMSAFEKWGGDCVPHLLGDFAFAVWDGVKRELFLARDHIGMRPLFFHANSRFCMFATAISGLYANPAVPRDIDDRTFLIQLAVIPRNPDETFYTGISRVPLAHCVTVSGDVVRQASHWDPEAIPELRYKRDEDYVDAFREILDASVRCRLRTIHPLGSHLSSGLDSSTVTVTAARLLAQEGRKLTAYTAVPPKDWQPKVKTDSIVNEGIPAARLAAQCGVEHVAVEAGPVLDFGAYDRHGDFFETPRRAYANVGWIEQLNLAARTRGDRVLLCGGLGNRALSYDGVTRLSLLARRGEFAELAREWTCLHRREGMRYRHLAARSFGQFVPDWLWEVILFFMGRPPITGLMLCGIHPGWFTSAQLKRIGKGRIGNPTNARRLDDRMMRAICSRSPDMAMNWGFSLAAFDLEIRDPTADKRMIAFRMAVPERQFLYRGQTKWLLRRAMRDILPGFILDQRHHAGQQAAEWFDAATRALPALRDEIERLAANPRTAAAFNILWFRRMLDEWPSALSYDGLISNRYRRFLICVTAARFMRRFIEQQR